MPQQFTKQELLQAAATDQSLRIAAAQSDFKKFVAIYLNEAFNDAIKPFHHRIMDACGKKDIKHVLITGFRGSGKSTIASTAFVLWAALTKQYRFIIVIGDTGEQAKQSFRNIRVELEENELIKADFGDMHGRGGPERAWQTQKLILANGVQILGRSRGQKVRGLKYGRYRPDCIVIDDPEESDWVRTKENRDKTERWIRQEVFPSMAAGNTKVVVIGNYLHNDALLARLKQMSMFKHTIDIPLFDDNGVNAWPERFTPEVVELKKEEAGFIGWNREYLLKVVPDEGQIITPADIHYYDAIPEDAKAGMNVHGVDLAISKEQSADSTAVVNGIVYRMGVSKKARLIIEPGTVNRKLDFKETTDLLQDINNSGDVHLFFVEDVAYQKVAIETLRRYQVPVTAVRPIADKSARLRVASQFIKDGTVQFPRTGCEALLTQLYGFGAELHDDMCFSADTLILTDHGEVPIKNVKAGDRVMTRQGYKRVLAGGITGYKPTIERFGLRGTADHPIITTRGLIPLQYVKASDIVYIWNQSQSSIEKRRIDDSRNQNCETIAYITGDTINGNHPRSHFIDKSTSTRTVRLKTAITCIIKTAIHSITNFLISKQNHAANISAIICGHRNDERNQGAQSYTPSWQLPNGIALMPEGSGIANTASRSLKIESRNTRIAKCAALDLNTLTQPLNFAGVAAMQRIGADAIPNTMPHSLLAKKKAEKQPVYNLTIEGAHEFFANGILVHNCDALVYLILGTVAEGLDLQKVVWLDL